MCKGLLRTPVVRLVLLQASYKCMAGLVFEHEFPRSCKINQHCASTLQRCTLIINVWPLHTYSHASPTHYLHYVPTYNGLWLKAMHWLNLLSH